MRKRSGEVFPSLWLHYLFFPSAQVSGKLQNRSKAPVPHERSQPIRTRTPNFGEGPRQSSLQMIPTATLWPIIEQRSSRDGLGGTSISCSCALICASTSNPILTSQTRRTICGDGMSRRCLLVRIFRTFIDIRNLRFHRRANGSTSIQTWIARTRNTMCHGIRASSCPRELTRLTGSGMHLCAFRTAPSIHGPRAWEMYYESIFIEHRDRRLIAKRLPGNRRGKPRITRPRHSERSDYRNSSAVVQRLHFALSGRSAYSGTGFDRRDTNQISSRSPIVCDSAQSIDSAIFPDRD